MKRIIIDTSFLIHAVKFRIDIREELAKICDFSFKIQIIDKTIQELKKKKDSKEDDLFSEIALKIASDFEQIKTEGSYVDDLILENIDPEDSIVATQDKELRKRVQKKDVPVIVIRQKKYFQFEG